MENTRHGQNRPPRRSITAGLANGFGAMEVAVRQRPMRSLGIVALGMAALGVVTLGVVTLGVAARGMRAPVTAAATRRRRLR